jgi:hypothetical protein
VTSTESVSAGGSVTDSGLASSHHNSCTSSVNSSPSLTRGSPPDLSVPTPGQISHPRSTSRSSLLNMTNSGLAPALPPREIDIISHVRPRAPPDYRATLARHKGPMPPSSMTSYGMPGQKTVGSVNGTLRRSSHDASGSTV